MQIQIIMTSPEVSTWLKTSLQSALLRDPVDAARDADLLAKLLGDQADRKLASSLG
jgi:hypothetical protein